LEDYGLSKIVLQDDGQGIPDTDAEFMAQRYYTTKLATFEDLSSVESLGFRGEALNAICAISQSVSLVNRASQRPG
jgi:DNA mismatch repair protein PMS2